MQRRGSVLHGYRHWLYLASFSAARVSARHWGCVRPKWAVAACEAARSRAIWDSMVLGELAGLVVRLKTVVSVEETRRTKMGGRSGKATGDVVYYINRLN